MSINSTVADAYAGGADKLIEPDGCELGSTLVLAAGRMSGEFPYSQESLMAVVPCIPPVRTRSSTRE